MTISGNINSISADTVRAASGEAIVQSVKITGDTKVWPAGLLLSRADAVSAWVPYTDGDLGLLAVLDEETDTSSGDAALAVRHGSVKLDVLKVGVDAPAPPTATQIFALEQNHIYPV